METKAGNPGAFAHFDLNRVDSPAFVVDAAKIRANCQVLAGIRDEAMSEGASIKVFSALKAFSMWSVAPIIGEYLDGVCTSGLWEARLASEFYDGEIASYSAAFKPEDLEEICRLSDHVIFNSPAQMQRAALAAMPPLPGGLFPREPMLEFDTTDNRFRDDLLVEPLDIQQQVKATGGYVSIPTGPGLGVEPDREFIDRYRIDG